jgi:hypothetical protein
VTTQVEPGTFRSWRVNRVQATLNEVLTRCADPRLTRGDAQQLAQLLREAALVVADLYVCPVCGQPEVCACVECPVGSPTSTAAPDTP